MSNEKTADELEGMAWWNALTEYERAYWMRLAGDTGVAADAWATFKTHDLPPPSGDAFKDWMNRAVRGSKLIDTDPAYRAAIQTRTK